MFRRLYEEMQVELMDKHPYDDIFSSLNEIQKKLRNDELVDWRFVRLHLGITKPSKKDSEAFYFLCQCMFQLIKEHKCTDLSIIADTIQIYSFEHHGSKNSFHKAKVMRDILMNNDTCIDKEGLNFVAKLMKMPYKTPSFIPYEPMYDVIQPLILSKNIEHLKFLLEYGVMYIQLPDHRSTWTQCFQKLSLLLENSEKQMLVKPREFQLNIGKLSPVSRQRMLAVFRAVEIILKSRDSFLGVINYSLGFRMAYETIPEPFITSREVVDFLHYVFSGPSANEFIERVRKDYEDLFREKSKTLNPRPLTHLCRCQIRQNFRQAGIFPFGIENLNYPQNLKDYILAVENKPLKKECASFFNFGPNYIVPQLTF